MRYADAYERKLHTEMYGFEKAFRVAIVVAGDDWAHTQKMISVFQLHLKNAVPGGIFLHTTAEELSRHGIRSARWITAAGKPAKIIGGT